MRRTQKMKSKRYKTMLLRALERSRVPIFPQMTSLYGGAFSSLQFSTEYFNLIKGSLANTPLRN
jgi:hypothetical protein